MRCITISVLSLIGLQYIFYVSGHTAVILDRLRNEQYLLQGHSNAISCSCVRCVGMVSSDDSFSYHLHIVFGNKIILIEYPSVRIASGLQRVTRALGA